MRWRFVWSRISSQDVRTRSSLEGTYNDTIRLLLFASPSKKCRSFKWPQHSSVFAWGEGLSTFAPQQHRGLGCRRNRRRCTSHWQLRSTPRCGCCGPSALSRWRWLLTTSPPADNVAGNGVLEPGWENFASTRSARNPSKFWAKTKFGN